MTAPFPHCDSNVLHAPGECEVCDHYPERQQDRIAKGINFTGGIKGKKDPALQTCPSELHRDVDTIHKWRGNRPCKGNGT